MAYGRCCRRAGASGKEVTTELLFLSLFWNDSSAATQETNSELTMTSRKLILKEKLMSISAFFFFFFLVRATDLSEAEPTLTHMSIASLHKHNLVRFFFPMPYLSCTAKVR